VNQALKPLPRRAFILVGTLPRVGLAARTNQRTHTRRARVSRTSAINQTVAYGAVLAMFAVICTGVHVHGCMRLDAASTNRARLQSALLKVDRTNLCLQSKVDSLTHPDRLSTVAEGKGMTPVVPSTLVSCSPPARMVKAVSPFSSADIGD